MTVLALLLLSALVQGPEDARAEATRLARAGLHQQALERFQAIAAADPRDLEARIWIGRLHNWMGHLAKAEEVFRGVLAEHPENVEALVGLGTVLAARGRRDEGLSLLDQAEALAPESADVLAAQGRALRTAGRTERALAYFRRAQALSPHAAGEDVKDPDIREGLEHTRRIHGHRLEAAFFHESFREPVPDAGSGEAAVNLRLNERLRLFARGQTQRKFSQTESRGGGGAEWRGRPDLILRAYGLFGPGNQVLPRTDMSGEVEAYRRKLELFGGVRRVGFEGVRALVLSPGVTYWVNDGLAVGARYYRSYTDFVDRDETVGNDSAGVRARVRVHPRVWLDAGYARGVESFETLSADRLGRFRADTLSAGARVDLPSLTSLAAVLEHQWRSGGGRMFRITASAVHRF